MTRERQPPQWMDPKVYDLQQVVNAGDDYKYTTRIVKFLRGIAEHLEHRVGEK